MMMRTLASSFLFVVASAAAYANNDGAVKDVSLDDLKAKCKELTANPQLKPVKVKITCNELSHFWKEGQPTQGLLKNMRKTGATVQMKGFQIPHTFFDTPVQDSPVPCAQYVKMEKVVSNVDTEIGCTELLDITDLGAYCAPIIDARTAQDPGLVTISPTSETLGFCPSI